MYFAFVGIGGEGGEGWEKKGGGRERERATEERKEKSEERRVHYCFEWFWSARAMYISVGEGGRERK